jgi:hypothetical protein
MKITWRTAIWALLLVFCLAHVHCASSTKPVQKFENIHPRASTIILRSKSHRFPRLFNQLHDCCGSPKIKSLLDQLHYWDIEVINAEVVSTNPEYLGATGLLRTRNPNAILIAYFSGADVNPDLKNQPIHRRFIAGLEPSWYLKDVSHKSVPLFQLPTTSEWTIALNPTTKMNQFVPALLNQNVLSTRLVDGILYDWASTEMSWINHRKPPQSGPLDMDQDGKADSDDKVDERWTKGYFTLLENSRKFFPPESLVIANGGWNTGDIYSSVLNGIMIEQFMEGAKKSRERFGWKSVMQTYLHYMEKSVFPQFVLVMANHDKQKNFDFVRFALASTLMFDGYFCFTNRTGPYSSAFWVDEYSVDPRGVAKQDMIGKGYLGIPTTKAFSVEDTESTLDEKLDSEDVERTVWRRDFENGIVLVNPDKKDHLVKLNGRFRKIQGVFDSDFNDGSFLDEIILKRRQGVILLRSSSFGRP